MRYPDLHPLLFARSVERSQSAGELFDILEEIPDEFPLIWDENVRRWVVTSDILQSEMYQQAERDAEEYEVDPPPSFE